MLKNAKKIFGLSMILSLLVGSVALAALPNMYGKDYSKTQTGHICKMSAEGNGNLASTTASNTANGKRYYSAYVNRRYAVTNEIIEKDSQEKLVASGNKIVVSVARYRSTDNREHYHKAMSWNCTTPPSGAGYTNYLDDTLTYTIKQTK